MVGGIAATTRPKVGSSVGYIAAINLGDLRQNMGKRFPEFGRPPSLSLITPNPSLTFLAEKADKSQVRRLQSLGESASLIC